MVLTIPIPTHPNTTNTHEPKADAIDPPRKKVAI